jgi:rhodanese-related sulfurtransferase
VTNSLSVREAAQLIADNRGVLLDVREQHEWLAVRAPVALHVPMHELAGSIERIPIDKTIACICHVGVRSAAVAQALTAAGFDAVNVTGGMEAWEAAGLPVERG